MAALIATLTVAWLGAGCFGAGRLWLVTIGLRDRLEPGLAGALAMAIGVGTLGWTMFFVALAGWLSPLALVIVAVPGVFGLASRFGAGPTSPARTPPFWSDPVVAALLAVLAAIMVLDVIHASAPPADADSLAYHFALPKLFLREGRLVFVPRAIDGAIPLLLQMTYLAALGLGGELAMTLWVVLLGWSAAWLVYSIGRRFLDRRWAMIVVTIFVTTPAIVFGKGSGQIEPKIVLFALSAGFAIAEARRTGDWRFAALAGLAASFFVGAKFTGPLFAASCGVVLLFQRRPIVPALAFGLPVIALGWQWYVWNAVHAGDPVFPMLFRLIGATDGLWSPAIDEFLRREWVPEENPVPSNLLWLFAYPFVATLQGIENWDSGRTGLGAFGLLIAPFALVASWRWRRQVTASPLFTMSAITLLFYVLWFTTRSSQRVRHLLPVYPFVLIALTAAALRLGRETRAVAPIALAVMLVLAVQIAGVGIFSLNYVRHLVTGESREAFLRRNVARFGPVPWINANLTRSDKILVTERQLVYHLDVPSFTASERYQHLVRLLPGESDARGFLDDVRRLGITHLLVAPALADFAQGQRHIWTTELATHTIALVAAGCAEVVHSEVMTAPRSRTLPGLASNSISSDVVRVDLVGCKL